MFSCNNRAFYDQNICLYMFILIEILVTKVSYLVFSNVFVTNQFGLNMHKIV